MISKDALFYAFCGGFVGSWLAMRGGAKFLRVGFMLALAVLMGKFGWDIVMRG